MRPLDDNGTCFLDTMAHYVTSLVEKRDFAGAIDYFESHRSDVEPSGEAAATILLSAARAYAATSNHPVALKTARLAQAAAEHGPNRSLLGEIFMKIGGILRDMGEFKEAERAFRDAESIFRRNDCPEGQSRALNQLAGLFFRQTDYRNSLTVLMDAVEIAKQLGDKKKLAFMMGNIGRISTFTGDFAKAEKHLTINVDLSRELGDRLETARALLSLGYVFIQRGDFAKAERTLADAEPLIAAEQSRSDEVCYLTYLGELYYRSGRFEDAQDALTQAVALADQRSSESPAAGRALRHLAELAVRRKDFRAAERHASRATVIMEKAGDSVEIGALLKIKGQIADARKQTETAARLFREAIDRLDESGVRWEMAEALWAAGASAAFSSRQRMTYLFRAEEFYARSRNRDKLDEIGKAISSIEFEPHRRNRGRSAPAERGVEFLTDHEPIKRFLAQLPALSRSDLPVLLGGETGVGKDHMARYFHSLARPSGPFVAINCASVPETLLESELFGYRKGAFTGADGNKDGLFVKANGGVLFLDEIGDMPLTLQTKLLGVLERRRLLPLGSTSEIKLDIKLVAATNQDLETMVESGSFRRDLYYRLSGITFTIPPLRERREDISLLVRHFMDRHGLIGEREKISSELMKEFISYDWPGNVRELDNKIRRLEIMAELVAEGDLVELSRSIFGSSDQRVDRQGSLFDRVEKFERDLLIEALTAAQGNKSEAARILGVHEATVRTKLKRYGITYPVSVAV